MRDSRVRWFLVFVVFLLFFSATLVTAETIDNPELFRALVADDSARVKRFIDDGVDVNALIKPVDDQSEEGVFPLVVWAITAGPETTALLIEAGAEINGPLDGFGYVPWQWAVNDVAGASIETLRLLLDRGADMEARTRWGATALIEAFRQNQLAKVRVLVDAGADINVRHDGRTPLLHLLDDGPRPRPLSLNDDLRLELTRLLLDAGADPNASQSPSSARPLTFAAKTGGAQVVQLLLSRGAKIDAVDGSWGRTALHWAAERGQLAAVKVLVEAGADLEIEDILGGTPLDAAKRFRGRRADMEALVDYLTDAVAGL